MSYEALKKRHDQGWVKEIFDDVEKLLMRVKEAKNKQEVSKSRSVVVAPFCESTYRRQTMIGWLMASETLSAMPYFLLVFWC